MLSDPGIELDARARHEVASGAIDRRVLAVLAFLSRSGLKPTVQRAASWTRLVDRRRRPLPPTRDTGGAVDDLPDQRHPDRRARGRRFDHRQHDPHAAHPAGRIRAQPDRQPDEVPRRHEHARHARRMPTRSRSTSRPPRRATALTPAEAAKAAKTAHSATSGQTAPAPFVASGTLSLTQWNELLARIGALPAPTVAAKPTSAAIRDPQAAPSNRGLGAAPPASGGWSFTTAAGRLAAIGSCAAGGRCSAAGSTGCRSTAACATPERRAQVALALDLGRFELGAARVDAFGVEHGAVARGVRGGHVHAVFAQAGRELRERRLEGGAFEARATTASDRRSCRRRTFSARLRTARASRPWAVEGPPAAPPPPRKPPVPPGGRRWPGVRCGSVMPFFCRHSRIAAKRPEFGPLAPVAPVVVGRGATRWWCSRKSPRSCRMPQGRDRRAIGPARLRRSPRVCVCCC